MTHFEILSLYVALHSLLLVVLSFRVGQVRMEKQVNLGDGGHNQLRARIRAHGNYIEYAPFALIGLFTLAYLDAAPLMLHIFGAGFFIARILHAMGMAGKNALGKGRLIGMLMTVLTLIGQAGCILFLIFT